MPNINLLEFKLASFKYLNLKKYYLYSSIFSPRLFNIAYFSDFLQKTTTMYYTDGRFEVLGAYETLS